jgi:hypothetical protein
MMRFTPILAAALMATAAVPASASETQDVSKEEKAKEKLVCKTQPVTGSRSRTTRTCMTQREWDRLASGNRKETDDYVDRLNQAPPPPD